MTRAGAIGWVAVLLVGGCGGKDDPMSRAQPIAGGQADTPDSAVVGIVDLVNGSMADICTGTLISPNAVLTAYHCVSELTEMASVNCATAAVGALRPAGDFYVTTAPTFPITASAFLRVREIVVPSATSLCGSDVAVLILESSVPAAEAAPLAPVIAGPPQPAARYSAVGYGGTNDEGDGVGTRRRRDGLRIACVGAGCGSAQVVSAEYAGDAGVCPGDSGGPALDAAGRIVGIASRGGSGCSSSIYESAFAQLDFLRAAVEHAASLGGTAVPAWVAGAPSAPLSSDGGCRVGARGGAGSVAPILVAWGMLLRNRRRRATR